MAVKQTTIEAVRIYGADGSFEDHPWDPLKHYLLRDDQPILDILTRGNAAQFDKNKAIGKLEKLTEHCADGLQWQRWNLSEPLSSERRFGEVCSILKVPKNCTLRCYVIPTAFFSFPDIMRMLEDIESELGVDICWDNLADRPDRSWIQQLNKPRASRPTEVLQLIEQEVWAATSIRHSPFKELGPRSMLRTPLAENAIVSHWAMRRSRQLRDFRERLESNVKNEQALSVLSNPEERQKKIDGELKRLNFILQRADKLKRTLARFVNDVEIGTQVHPSPLFQRDHRLRLLLRAFAPSPSEAISEVESARSSFPPIFLNHLWELWGIVWIVKELRKIGFSGRCTADAVETVSRCSWHLTKDEVTIKLDFEPEPALINYADIPPLHERAIPVMEWAALNQEINSHRPFIGSEKECSPDYLIRILTPTARALLVGDACLASPKYHGRKKGTSKPEKVERYRRTIGWVDGDQVIRCHPMGGFVIFPPPAHGWSDFEAMPGVRDCMLVCPNPRGDLDASRRLLVLLEAIVPEVGA